MINTTIKVLQQRLNGLGYSLATDGIAGPKTKAALKEFQTRLGLPPTGTATSDTVNALLKMPAATPPNPNLRPPPADVMSGGRPSPAPGVPPQPQTRPGDGQPPVRLGTGASYPGGVPTPSLRPGDVPQPVFASQPALSQATSQPQAPPLPGAGPAATPAPNAGARFAPPPFDAMRRMNATLGDQAASAAWRYNLPSIMGGIQTGGMGNTGAPQMTMGGSGRPNMAPLAGQAGDRGGPAMPPAPTDAQKAAAVAALRSALQSQQGRGAPVAAATPQSPQQRPPFNPTQGNPGYGLPGLPPSPTFMGAVANAGGALGNLINRTIGVQPAMGSGEQAPTPAQPLSDAPLSSDDPAVSQALRNMILQQLFSMRVQPQPSGQFLRRQFNIPATPPPPPFSAGQGQYR